MKKKTFLIPAFLILSIVVLTSSNFSNSSAEINETNGFMVYADYTDCNNFTWSVTVEKNGGGYTESCQIIQPGSCKCPVANNPSAGYYTVTVDNGSCSGTENNVYYSGSGILEVYVNAAQNCYR